jgi:hypothetical protein
MGEVHSALDTQAAEYRAMSAAESVLSALLRALPLKHGRHRLLDKIKPEHWPHASHGGEDAVQGSRAADGRQTIWSAGAS